MQYGTDRYRYYVHQVCPPSSVEPNLGDLKWACATVPTPQGDIEVEVENGCIKLRVPMGATAEYCGKVFSGSCFVKMKLERGK